MNRIARRTIFAMLLTVACVIIWNVLGGPPIRCTGARNRNDHPTLPLIIVA
jgi:hypothetical protein